VLHASRACGGKYVMKGDTSLSGVALFHQNRRHVLIRYGS
jgi:hypothetical protein